MNFDGWKKLPHGPLDRERLRAFEDALGTALPAGFLRWLQMVNGGKPENACIVVSDSFGVSCLHHVYGLHQGGEYQQLDSANRILVGNLNSGLVAFADDAGGNQFAISLRPEGYGTVVFWDHETGDEYVVGKDFEEFLLLLRDEQELIPRGDLETVLRADDPVLLDRWLEGKDIDAKDTEGCSPIEWAAVYGSVSCIVYLHSLHAKPFDALAYAKRNLRFFPDHQATVDLLERLYPEKPLR